MINEELKNKYNIDTHIAACYCLVYSYAADSIAPIVFSRYTHDHYLSAPIFYKKNDKWCTLYFYLTGKIEFMFDNSVCNPSYGNAVIIRDNERHTVCLYKNSYFDYYEMNFPVEFFEKITPDNPFYEIFYNRNSGEKNIINLDPLRCNLVIEKFTEIEKIINSGEKFADLSVYSYILQIINIIYSCYNETPADLNTHKIPSKLKEAVDYINLNFTTITGIDEVALHCKITEAYLSRLFRKFNFPKPNEYLTTLRVSHAKYLLSTGASLTNACFDSGFNNYTYFISKFRQITGETPAKFRDNHKLLSKTNSTHTLRTDQKPTKK